MQTAVEAWREHAVAKGRGVDQGERSSAVRAWGCGDGEGRGEAPALQGGDVGRGGDQGGGKEVGRRGGRRSRGNRGTTAAATAAAEDERREDREEREDAGLTHGCASDGYGSREMWCIYGGGYCLSYEGAARRLSIYRDSCSTFNKRLVSIVDSAFIDFAVNVQES